MPPVGGFNPEVYRAVALKGPGKPDRGRKLFSDLKGLACIKCHAVGKEGGAVGPELSSIASKYPRDELIAAVLYPSAKISSGYEPSALALSDGRVLNGIIRNETPDSLELQDADARTTRIAKDQVEEAQAERRLTDAQRPRRGPQPPGLRRSDRLPGDPQESRGQG